ncbi:Alpha-ketoglutarate-dependent dioxygenase alkB-like protein 3 [Armadillidium vulgare]|nr:Alpha-ketoglutarate-dependent dioxygenase alkB-like protein 3 [Armadillidium vulgare]
MSLYNTGYSNQPWHSEVHEAMPKNPTTACISLGVTRTLEMKRKNGAEYLRFPLFPGSLFVMEGACHADWQCQIPKEPQIKGERIDLSFRTMLMIKGVTV